MRSTPLGAVRSIVLATDDVDATRRFFVDHLGFELKFQDGDRWATLELGAMVIALAGHEQRPPTGVAINVKVDDVDAALTRAVALGADVIETPFDGEHEVRAGLRAPGGPMFYLYAPLLAT